MALEHMTVRAIYLDAADRAEADAAGIVTADGDGARYRGLPLRRSTPGKPSRVYSNRGLCRAIAQPRAPRPVITPPPLPSIGARVRFSYTTTGGRQRSYEARVTGYRKGRKLGSRGWIETIDDAGFRRSVPPARCEVLA